MLLQDKVAVRYGAGGAIGGAVARAVACEGPGCCSPGATGHRSKRSPRRSPPPADPPRRQRSTRSTSKPWTSTPVGDDTAGRVDSSCNAIGLPHPKLRVPLVELDAERFSLPDRDLPQVVPSDRPAGGTAHGAEPIGVIMTVTATPSRTGTPLVGGRRGPAMAAVEARTRGLSAELAPQGIRVVGLRPPGIPDTGRITEAFETRRPGIGHDWEQFQESLAPRTHMRRRSTLAELANLAVFMASEKANGMTGTTLNPTMGSPDD